MQLAELIRNRKYQTALAIGAVVFALGTFSWIYLARYLQAVPSRGVFDYPLALIPVIQNAITINVYVYLYIFGIIFAAAVLAYKEPRKLPLALLIAGLFILVGNLFFSTTILEPPPDRPDRLIAGFEFDKDLFPSKHVGLPFVIGLVTQILWLRYLMFGLSVILGIDVLLLHIHYSFDVLGGYVVGYAVYKLAHKYLGKWFEFSAAQNL